MGNLVVFEGRDGSGMAPQRNVLFVVLMVVGCVVGVVC